MSVQKRDERLLEVYANRVRVRVCGICLSGDKILMAGMRLPGRNHLFWAPPGGGVQFGESCRDTLMREFLEETGLDVEVGEMLFLNEFIQPPLHAIEIFFRITSFRGDMYVGHDPEFERTDQIIESIRFMSLEEIQKLPDGSLHSIFDDLLQLEDLSKKTSF